MNTRQSFLSGDDLKKGIQELCAHVSGLPDDVLSQGLLKLSGGIAEDDRFLPAQLSLKTVGHRVKSEDIAPPEEGHCVAQRANADGQWNEGKRRAWRRPRVRSRPEKCRPHHD